MDKTVLKYQEYEISLKKLLDKTYDLLNEFQKEDVFQEVKNELATNSKRNNLKVAFVGQYNAGKSTIIKALTGNKSIRIDSNVATDVSKDYNWNNIKLTDTPGILAGKFEKHDEMTLNTLKESDLIVYVLTSQLFDDLTFENFIGLAYKQQFKDKMLLVVNKMSMESGEFEELKVNYLESLKTIFRERNYDFDFPVVFTDAADYIEGMDDEEEDLIELSNFNIFNSSLNKFIESKGVIARAFDTPLRLVRSKLKEVLVTEEDPSFNLVLKKYETRLRNYRRELSKESEFILDNLQDQILSEGYKVTSALDEELTTEQFQIREQKFKEFVEENCSNSMTQLKMLINDKNAELEDEIKLVNQDLDVIEYTNNIKENWNSKTQSHLPKNSVSGNKLGLLENLGSYTDNFSKYLGMDKASGLFARAGEISGSQGHQMIKEVGHFVGYKFRPWEAVNITKNIGNVAKFAGPVLAGVGLVSEVYDSFKEKKELQKKVAAKNQMNEEFHSISKDVTAEIRKKFKVFLSKTIDVKLNDIEKQKIEIVTKSEQNSKFSEAVKKLDSEYVDFIEVINKKDETLILN